MMNDLEMLREMFKDPKLHIGIGTIVQLGLESTGNKLRVMVNLLPENRQVVAEMTFADVMDICFPEINDLGVVAFADGHPDECFVIALINNKDEPLPKFAQNGSKVAYSRPGKKFYIGSDTKLGIGRPNIEPTEPLVLGTQLIALLTGILTQINAVFSAISTGPVSDFGNLGAPVPTSAEIASAISDATTALEGLASTYLATASTNIVSQIGFTERGA
jgi:hypothetical protein